MSFALSVSVPPISPDPAVKKIPRSLAVMLEATENRKRKKQNLMVGFEEWCLILS
jgi:hypothetical protein